jgi:hypothetical protein
LLQFRSQDDDDTVCPKIHLAIGAINFPHAPSKAHQLCAEHF